MKSKAAHVFKGWIELTQDEKNEVISAINEYMNSAPTDKLAIRARALNESKASLSFDTGPTGGGCPCCGR